MNNKISFLTSVTIIFSLLLPTVIPRSYKLQIPEQNSLLISSSLNCKHLVKSTSNLNEAIEYFNFIKNIVISFGDKFISYGYKDTQHSKKIKFRVEEEKDTAQSFIGSIIDFYSAKKNVLKTNFEKNINNGFSMRDGIIVGLNILTVLSKRVE